MSNQTLGTPLGRDPKFLGELSGPKVRAGELVAGLPAAAADLAAGQMQPVLDGTDLVLEYKDADGVVRRMTLGDHHWAGRPDGSIAFPGVAAVDELRGAADLWRVMLATLAMNAPLNGHEVELFAHAKATQGRGTVAWYQDAAGVWRQAAAGASRFEGGRYLHEPQRTNKVAVHNANPDGVAGMTLYGDPAAALTVEADAAALAAVGLAVLCGAGNVWKLDNSAGGAVASCQVPGAVGNLNPHVLSTWVRGGSGRLMLGASPADGYVAFGTSSGYQRVISNPITPTTTGRVMYVEANPGQVVYFIAPQVEEGSSPTSPIVTAGAAASRAADNLYWPLSPAMLAALADQGTLIIEAVSDGAGHLGGIVSTASSADSLLSYNTNGLRSFDGGDPAAGVALTWTAGAAYLMGVRWNKATALYQDGFSTNGGASWTWGATAAGFGGWDIGGGQRLYLGWGMPCALRARGLRMAPAWLDDADLATLAGHLYAGVLSLGVADPRALVHLAGGIVAAALIGSIRGTLTDAAPALEPGQWGAHLDGAGSFIITSKDGGGVVRTHTTPAD